MRLRRRRRRLRKNSMFTPLENLFHEKVEALTEDAWCPYPSKKFMDYVMNCPNDKVVIELILERRRCFYFLSGWTSKVTLPDGTEYDLG